MPGSRLPGSKLTVKEERFAQLVHETGSATQAYRGAYTVGPTTKDSTVHRRAYEVLHRPRVADRIKELQAAVAERHNITQGKLVDMAMEAFDMAKANEEASAMTSAVVALARITGNIHDRPVLPSGPINLIYVKPGQPAEAGEVYDGEFTEEGSAA